MGGALGFCATLVLILWSLGGYVWLKTCALSLWSVLGLTCKHGRIRFCEQCVKESVTSELGYTPLELEMLLERTRPRSYTPAKKRKGEDGHGN